MTAEELYETYQQAALEANNCEMDGWDTLTAYSRLEWEVFLKLLRQKEPL